jgi:hypothetical protein
VHVLGIAYKQMGIGLGSRVLSLGECVLQLRYDVIFVSASAISVLECTMGTVRPQMSDGE